jgi:hypothetical protein
MKKIVFFLVTIAVFVIVSSGCQKSIVTQLIPKDSLTENGLKFAGWFISNPPTKFDIAGDRIYIEDTTNNVVTKLDGKPLVNSGPRYVYAVLSFIQGPLSVQKEDLKRRGWKIAPLSYLIGLGREYGTGYNYYGNLFCVDLPEKINFGSGDEDAAITLNGNTYNQQTNSQYGIGLWVTASTSRWGQTYILAYK